MHKHNLIEALTSSLQSTYDALKTELDGFKDGDTAKSSAGDKHETSKAMADIEAEKISQSLNRTKAQLTQLSHLKPDLEHTKIGLGSLFKANAQWYFIAIAYGKFPTSELGEVFVISSEAPICKVFLGKSVADEATFNTINFKILEVE